MTTVLHVDDDPDHRLIVKMVAGDWGVTLLQAESAAEADSILGELLEAKEKTLVVSDHMMPGERGASFLVRNLERCRRAGVPLWLLTSFADDDEVRAALEAGVDGVLDKPFDLGLFEQRLGQVVTGWMA